MAQSLSWSLGAATGLLVGGKKAVQEAATEAQNAALSKLKLLGGSWAGGGGAAGPEEQEATAVAEPSTPPSQASEQRACCAGEAGGDGRTTATLGRPVQGRETPPAPTPHGLCARPAPIKLSISHRLLRTTLAGAGARAALPPPPGPRV